MGRFFPSKEAGKRSEVKKSIVLVGMPGSGKSTIGKSLSRMMGMGFLDCDEYIERVEGRSLQEIIDDRGVEEFKRVEEARIMELEIEGCVVAPGGSFIYYPTAVKQLKKTSVIVFLDLIFEEVEARLDNPTKRGIVGLKTRTLKQLYDERRPLYLRHSDIVIDCTGKSVEEISEDIFQRLKG